MSSNASKEWSGTLKELTEKRDKIQRQIRHRIKEHKRLDKSESAEQDRAKRLQQTIKTLNSASEKIDKFLRTAAPRPVFAPAKPAFPASMPVRWQGSQSQGSEE